MTKSKVNFSNTMDCKGNTAIKGRRLISFLPFAVFAFTLYVSGNSKAMSRGDEPRIDSLFVTGLQDLSAKVKVEKADQVELGKINRDFGMVYRLKEILLQYKDPDLLRMDSTIGTIILNGPNRLFRVPQIKLNRKDEVGDDPGKKYSLMDLGIITRSSLNHLDKRYVKSEPYEGKRCHVFELISPKSGVVQYVIWIDPTSKLILKRDWLDGQGNRRATFLYQEPMEAAPGIWIPTRIKILNSENAVAGTTTYSNLKVNQGIDSILFQITP